MQCREQSPLSSLGISQYSHRDAGTVSTHEPGMVLTNGFVDHGSGILLESPHPLPTISLALLKGVSTLEGAGFGMLLMKIRLYARRHQVCVF